MNPLTPRAGLGLTLMMTLGALAHGQQSLPPPPDSGEKTVTLNPFTVEAERNSGYQAANVQSASKLALPIKDVPQTVTVLTSAFLQDIAAQSLREALVYVAGVTPNLGARNQDGFAIRGFNQPLTYLDGFRDGQEWASGETVHIAQLEVLKGPASNLYGNMRGFGGIVNRVSKKPQAEGFRAAEVVIGSHDFYRFTYDQTGAISDDKTWLYRVNAAYTDAGSYRDMRDLRRIFVAPVVTKQIGDKTLLTFYTEFLDTRTQEDLGIPAQIDPATNELVATALPPDRQIGEPWENTKLEKQSARLYVNHQLTDNWALRTATIFTAFNNPIQQVETLGVAADGRTLTRRAFDLNRWEDHIVAEIDLLGTFKIGPTKHNLLAGFEYNREKGRSNVKRKPLASIDIYDPVYGAPLPDFTGGEATNLLFRNGSYGTFINDQIELMDGRVQIFGGVRRDRATSKRDVQLPGGSVIDDPANKKTAPRYGFVLKPTVNLSLYGQVSEAFRPIFGATTPTFEALRPETGELKEFGAKSTFFDSALGVDLAFYEIVNSDQAVRLDPPNNSFFTNAGEQTGKGAELNLSYNTGNWNFIGGLIRSKMDTNIPGQPLVRGTYRTSWQFFGKYTFTSGPLKRLSLGAGVIPRAARTFVALGRTGTLDSYTRVDVVANYRYNERLDLSLRVENVLDEDYFLGNSSFMLVPGSPLNARLSIRYRF